MYTARSPIDDVLRARGVSGRTLERLGVCDVRTLRRIRIGRPVRPSTLRRLAVALGVPLDVVEMAVRVAAAERAA